MTLSEFTTRYRLTPESVEALFRKINVPPHTPIDEELEGILLNLSDTRVPVYPPSRRSALSPSELEILLRHYELYIEPPVFFEKGFPVFGKMLAGVLEKTGKTIAIPADMVVTLKNRMAAAPHDQQLSALKAVLVQLARAKRGVASSIKTSPGADFADMVFRACPGENLAILAKHSTPSRTMMQEAGRSRQALAFFTLDSRGFMRVNQKIAPPQPASASGAPTLYAQTPAPDPTDAPRLPLSPTMTGAGTVQRESAPMPRQRSRQAPPPPAALLHQTPQPLSPATPTSPKAAYPAKPSGEINPPPGSRRPPVQAPMDVYPAYPVQDTSPLTPGAVPHPFPGPETRPTKPPMQLEPFSAPSSATAPAAPSPAPPTPLFTRQNTEPSPMPHPKQETPPVVEPVVAENASPVPPADDTPRPAPIVPKPPRHGGDKAAPTPASALPPGVTRDAQGRLVKHGRLHKAAPGISPKDNRAASRQPTMKDRFVRGMEEGMLPEARDPHNQMQTLSGTLKALYAVLAVLGLGIVGILIYQFLL